MRADERDLVLGRRLGLRLAHRELGEIHAGDAVAGERFVDLRGDGPEVLTDHLARVAVGLEGQDREELLDRVADVGALIEGVPVRNPVEAGQRHDVVETEDPGEARLVGDACGQVAMPLEA